MTTPERQKLLARMLEERGLTRTKGGEPRAIPRRDSGVHLPLSFTQEGLWFLDRVSGGDATYSIPGTVRLHGPLDRGALDRAFGEILRRHAALRTTFTAGEDGPRQVVAPARPFELLITDLEPLPADQREGEARRLAEEEARRTFDLSQGPLFRAQLIRLAQGDHVLMVNVHHIVADGWSMGVFTRELTEVYGAFCRGEPSPLPDLPLQYSDFATWQRDRLQGETLEAELEFWADRLAGAPSSLELPTDHPRPPTPSYEGRHHPMAIGEGLSRELRRLAREERTSLYSTLLTAFFTLLFRHSGQTDLTIGSSYANRASKELEGLIGFFVHTLPVRIDASGDLTFRDLLGRVNEAILAVADHQGVPPAKLVSELQPARDVRSSPLYQVVFDLLTPDWNPPVYGYGLHSTVDETRQLPGLFMTPFDVEGGEARFDIAVFLWDMSSGLQGSLEYRTDLFERETIARLEEDFQRLLGYVVDAPDAKLTDLAERLRRIDEKRQKTELDRLRKAGRERLRLVRRRPPGAPADGTAEAT